jgi:hypothetical protein
MYRRLWLLPIILILLVACIPADNITPDGPRLVREVTLAPTDARATRFLSPTPIQATQARATAEIDSPLDNVTVNAQFILVTPTLPPSKTPTVTPTHSPTPTVTPTPTLTNTATTTALFLPTSELIPVTAPAVSQADRICDATWGFINPPPAGCPLGAPTASAGVYQEFSNGYMVWVGSIDAIYVLYKDSNSPRWETHRDFFNDQNPSMAYLDAPPRNLTSTTWSPRRGFGLLWAQNAAVRDRIGGAIQQWEQPFSVQVQLANDGVIFVTTPRSSIFGLMPGRNDWAVFTGSLPPPVSSVQLLPSPENQLPAGSGIDPLQPGF